MAQRTFLSIARAARTSAAWTLPEGTREFDLSVVGPDWTAGSGNELLLVLEQSFDAGATWLHWLSAGLTPTLDKDGAGLLPASIGWELPPGDRNARLVRVRATPNRAFRHGIVGLYS